MRKRGAKGAPTNANFKRAAKTAKKRKKKWGDCAHKETSIVMARKKLGKVKANELNMVPKLVKIITKNVIEDKDNG